MSSVLRPARKRKKVRKLGPVDIIRGEEYADLELDAKVKLIRSLVPLGLMHVHEVLDQEVTALAGPPLGDRSRCARRARLQIQSPGHTPIIIATLLPLVWPPAPA